MNLSVVILNYNVRFFLELCLKSVTAALTDLDAEIIVVDNNSTDDSRLMVRRLFPEVKLIQNTENLGFSKGNNIGVANAKGKYVCILNPDTVVPEDCFTELLKFAESKSDLGILGCQLIDGRGHFLPESKRNIPTPTIALKKILGLKCAYYAAHVEAHEIGKVDILVGAFMLLKTEVYKGLGGFDETYFMFGEDIDLSYTALKNGYNNYYNGQICIVHFKGESTIKDAVYAKRFFGAMTIFFKKHFKKGLLMNTLVALGAKIGAVFSREPEVLLPSIDGTYVFTKSMNEEVFRECKSPVVIKSNLEETVSDKRVLVYDLRTFTHKDVIADMLKKGQQRDICFRMIPKNSTFMIGSDSAQVPGDVMRLPPSLDE